LIIIKILAALVVFAGLQYLALFIPIDNGQPEAIKFNQSGGQHE